MGPSRRSKRWLVIAAVVLLPVVALVAAYLLFFTSEADAKLGIPCGSLLSAGLGAAILVAGSRRQRHDAVH